ncbi:MAG TPA: hypothetical protein VKV95_07605 [Terriglobia bacterium]|nr:hypothetical protein [Terriglobia bacterium]
MPSSSNLAPDRLRNAQPGEPVEVWIYSAFEKDHWVARRSGDLTHAIHPGTAVQIFNEMYEIMTAEGTVEPGYVVRYGLKKWDFSNAVRHSISYSPESQAQAAKGHLEEVYRQDLRKRIATFFFLAGLAPDPLQRKWEMETGLNMMIISAASTLTNFFIFMTVAQAYGSTPPGWVENVLAYLGFDSVARMLYIVYSGKPHGLFILSLPYLIWEALVRPENRAAKTAGPDFSLEGDQVIRRAGSGNLTIRSMVYDDLLAGAAPILFEDSVYRSLHWHEEGKGLRRRWVYEFEKMDADPKLKYREYTQPRNPQRQKVVEEYTRRRDNAHVMAMVWGTYPREEQFRLQTKFQFPAARWTSVTAGFFLAGAFLQGWALFMLGLPSFLMIGPIYMFLESAYRLYRAKAQGQPAASIVGLVLSLFVHPPQ